MGNRKREEIKKWLNANRLPHPDDAEWDRLYHPAVITWMDVTGRWPTYAAMPHIIETMGDDPDRDALKRVWDLWRASDYNVANIAGILDRYARDVGDAGGGDGEAGDAWARVLEKIRNQKRGFTDRERVAIHEAGGAYNIRTANDFELDREFRPAFIEAWRQSATADDAPAPEEETEG